MKKINYVRLSLDVLMALTFILLMNPRVLGGIAFHEIAGVAIGAAFLVHLLLNNRWIRNVTVKMMDKKLPARTRFSYFLNLLLLISMATIIVTGILISKYLFPGLGIANEHSVREIHNLAAKTTVAILGIHLGLHAKWIVDVWEKMLKLKGKKLLIRGIVTIVIVAAVLFGISWINQAVGTIAPTGGKAPVSFQGPPPGGDAAGNFQPPANGQFDGPRGHGGEGRGGSSIWNVIFTYSGFIVIIGAITYYLDTRVLWKRKSVNVQAN